MVMNIFMKYSAVFIISLCAHVIHIAHMSLVEFREDNFSLTSYCNPSITPYDVISWPKTKVHCGVFCASDENCAGYVYNVTEGCAVFAQNIYNETVCVEAQSPSLSAYVKHKACENGGYKDSNNQCLCVNGYVGVYCERLMEDCSEGYNLGGYRTDKKYTIYPSQAPAPFEVMCQMSTGTGITKIQTRLSPGLNFNRTWQEYKDGFEAGTPHDYWLGNDKIHWITTSSPQLMMVQLANTTRTYQRYHNNFVMASETNDYSVTFTASWTPSDPNKYLEPCWNDTSMKFSTYDRDNDLSPDNCASLYGAGFWFESADCLPCNPNGDIYPSLDVRLDIPNENYWTPTLGDWSPDSVGIVLTRMP